MFSIVIISKVEYQKLDYMHTGNYNFSSIMLILSELISRDKEFV